MSNKRDGTSESVGNEHETQVVPVKSEEQETGWERLKSTFTRNKYGESSPEVDFIWKSIFGAFWCGGATGAILAGMQAKEDFVRKNKEMIYNHPYLAKRRYLDHMILTMTKHGFSWAWRLSFFVGSFATLTSAMAVYQNKFSVHQFTIAAAITGGLFRINMGIRGVFAASVLGGVLGTGAGILVISGMWATGTSLEEIRYLHYGYWQRELRKKEEEIKARNLQKQLGNNDNSETPSLLLLHNTQMAEKNRAN